MLEAGLADLTDIALNPASDVPMYRQLADSVSSLIAGKAVQPGDKLPPTRELAGQLGVNRTTVSAAYALLERSGLIEGCVGRGSFVTGGQKPALRAIDWELIFPAAESPFPAPLNGIEISFANSRPAEADFPVAEFRRMTKQVIDGPDAPEILQLGSPHGYAPLRRYLLEDAVRRGIARPGDDLIITNGCQQALDLLARLFTNAGSSFVVEDPAYHGLVRILARTGAVIIPVPIDANGLDVDALETRLSAVDNHRPRVLIVTPSFQNPTGATLSAERRKRLVEIAQRTGLIVIENDIYSELRYEGSRLATLKELDASGNTILLRSYSKISFPGLRVGWTIAPRPLIARLAEARQVSDLHSDQLSQAVLFRFAESGGLAHHLDRTRRAGAARLRAVLEACKKYLPAGARFTRPEGGMNLWIELPAPLSAEGVLSRVQDRGVTFLPGRYFSTGAAHARALRISFGGLTPEQIDRGMRTIGEVARAELASAGTTKFQAAAALV